VKSAPGFRFLLFCSREKTLESAESAPFSRFFAYFNAAGPANPPPKMQLISEFAPSRFAP